MFYTACWLQGNVILPSVLSHDGRLVYGVIESLWAQWGMSSSLTLAQSSNKLLLTALGYDLWRRRSISLMTGEDFPLEREFRQFLDWVGPVSGRNWLDVGTSTGNYARVLVQEGATVTALDLSEVFLKHLPRHPRLHRKCGIMEETLFQPVSFDGVVIAGTLNETSSWQDMLTQSARALRENGLLYLMYLMPAQTFAGKGLQSFLGAGGIKFLAADTVRKYLQLQDFALVQENHRGIVGFELYIKKSGM